MWIEYRRRLMLVCILDLWPVRAVVVGLSCW